MQREKSSAVLQKSANWNVQVKYLPVAEDPGPWMLKTGFARSRQEIWESTGRPADKFDCDKIYNPEDEGFDVAEVGSPGGTSLCT